MTLDSSPVQARTVFRQDTPPENTDALWIDTSETGDPLKSYDNGTNSWEKVANGLETVRKESLIHSDGFAPGFAG